MNISLGPIFKASRGLLCLDQSLHLGSTQDKDKVGAPRLNNRVASQIESSMHLLILCAKLGVCAEISWCPSILAGDRFVMRFIAW